MCVCVPVFVSPRMCVSACVSVCVSVCVCACVQEYKRKQMEEQRQAERLQRQLQQERAYLVSLQQQQQEPRPQDKKQLYHYKDQAPSVDKPAWAQEVRDTHTHTYTHSYTHTLLQTPTVLVRLVSAELGPWIIQNVPACSFMFLGPEQVMSSSNAHPSQSSVVVPSYCRLIYW